jgi:hypothetical protein
MRVITMSFPLAHRSWSLQRIYCCIFDEKNYISDALYLEPLQDFTFQTTAAMNHIGTRKLSFDDIDGIEGVLACCGIATSAANGTSAPDA